MQWYLYFLQTVKFCKFFTVVSNTRDVVHKNKTIHWLFCRKIELISWFVISLVLSLDFSINDTRSSGSVAKWNSTSLLKHDYISGSLCSSISMPVTHCVLTNLPKNVLIPSFWRKYVFHMLSYPQLTYFRENVRRKLTYFQLPFIISSQVDFKLFICSKNGEFNKYSNGGWAYIDVNSLNLSHKCMAGLSNVKNSYIFCLNFSMKVCSMLFFFFSNFI